MFDVGFSEIMLIMIIALIVVGPERLPKLARTIGRWVGKARTIVSSVRSEVEREIRVDELKKSIQQQTPVEEFKQLADEMKSVGSSVESAGRDVKAGITRAGDSIKSGGSSSPSPAAKPAAGGNEVAVETTSSSTSSSARIPSSSTATPSSQSSAE